MENDLMYDPCNSLPADALSQPELERIQWELWTLLEKKTLHYTMGDSCSVTAEKAEELMRSIVFLIRLAVSKNAGASLQNNRVDELFDLGILAAEAMKAEGERLLQSVKASKPDIENIACHHTIDELEAFFKMYDIQFFAHDIPCMIDYPLAIPVQEELQGIEFMMAYLQRFQMENMLLGKFDSGRIVRLLQSYAMDYRQDVINLFEPVFINAIGLSVLGGDPLLLDISENALSRLENRLKLMNPQDRSEFFVKVAEILGRTLCVNNELRSYMADFAEMFSVRLNAFLSVHDSLCGIFLPFYTEREAEEPFILYEDGDILPDEALRDVMKELSSISAADERVAFVKRKIGSMLDLVEVLGACFWGEESKALLKVLTNEERHMLMQYVSEKREYDPGWRSHTNWESGI